MKQAITVTYADWQRICNALWAITQWPKFPEMREPVNDKWLWQSVDIALAQDPRSAPLGQTTNTLRDVAIALEVDRKYPVNAKMDAARGWFTGLTQGFDTEFKDGVVAAAREVWSAKLCNKHGKILVYVHGFPDRPTCDECFARVLGRKQFERPVKTATSRKA